MTRLQYRRVRAAAFLVDVLEARRHLALTVAGTAGSDLIVLSRSDASIVVSVNGTPTIASAADAQTAGGIVVNAGDGADTIRVAGLGDVVATINGEAGSDSIILGNGSLAGLLANVTVSGGSGADSLSIDDSLAGVADAIDISNPTNTFLTIARAGAASIFADIGTAASAVESITVSTSTVGDAINVSGTSSLTALTILSGDGNDSVHLGNDIDSNLLGNISVNAGTGSDSLALDDSADSFGDTYSLGGGAGVGVLTKNSGGGAMSYSGVEALTLTAGAGGFPVPNNQQFRVSYLPTGTATTILAGSGDDALRVGDGVVDLATAINAPLFFDGGDDVDRIDYLGTVGVDNASYTVNPASLEITGNATLGYAQLESLNVQANNGSNFMRVVGTTDFMNVTLNGGGGDDLFVVGNGDIDSTIANSVAVVGGAGYDNLFLDDSSDDPGNDTYNFSAGLLNRAQRAVLWSTGATDAVEYVQLTGSPNNDIINVNGIGVLSHLRIDAGAGNDAIFVARTTDGTSAPSAPLSIVSGSGNDTLDVNSDFAGSDATVELGEPAEDLAELDIRGGGRANILPVVVANADRVLAVRSRLTISGILDVNDQTLLVSAAAAPFAAVNTLGTTGYANGVWTRTSGPAIVSSASASSTVLDGLAIVTAGSVGTPTYRAFATVATDTIVRYTLAGDANLDRTVDFNDLLILAANYGETVGGHTWAQGNFDYDAPDPLVGSVAFNDLLMLAKNYGSSVPTVAATGASVARRR